MKRLVFFITLAIAASGPARLYSIESTPMQLPPSIDGDASDWSGVETIRLSSRENVVYKPENWSGSGDLSVEVGIAHDGRFLYIIARVKDDVVCPASRTGSALKSDHVEVWIDLSGLATLVDPTADDTWIAHSTWQLALTDDGAPRGFFPENDDTLAKNTTCAFTTTDDGYIVEAAIDLPAGLGNMLNWPADLALLVDVVDCDDASRPAQDCLLSLSPSRKWGDPATFVPVTREAVHLWAPRFGESLPVLLSTIESFSVVKSVRWLPSGETGGFVVWDEFASSYGAYYKKTTDGFSFGGDVAMGSIGFEAAKKPEDSLGAVVVQDIGPVLYWVDQQMSRSGGWGPCSAGYEEGLKAAVPVGADTLTMVLDAQIGSCFESIDGGEFAFSDDAREVVVNLMEAGESRTIRYVWRDGRYVEKK